MSVRYNFTIDDVIAAAELWEAMDHYGDGTIRERLKLMATRFAIHREAETERLAVAVLKLKDRVSTAVHGMLDELAASIREGKL